MSCTFLLPVSDVKRNVTEVVIGSTDYLVVPLNGREKRLLKAPSFAHLHKLLLELVSGVKLVSREIVHRAQDGFQSSAPYEVVYEYGWDRRKSAAAFLVKVTFKIRLSQNGTVIVDEWKYEVKRGPTLVDNLVYLELIDDRDYQPALKVLSTVITQAEAAEARCIKDAERAVNSTSFRKALHRWVRLKMKEAMRQELAPLLARYPADALVEHLSELVVEELHEA